MADAGYNLDPLESARQDSDVASGCVRNQPHTCTTNRLGYKEIIVPNLYRRPRPTDQDTIFFN
jgi:hypothetical protein